MFVPQQACHSSSSNRLATFCGNNPACHSEHLIDNRRHSKSNPGQLSIFVGAWGTFYSRLMQSHDYGAATLRQPSPKIASCRCVIGIVGSLRFYIFGPASLVPSTIWFLAMRPQSLLRPNLRPTLLICSISKCIGSPLRTLCFFARVSIPVPITGVLPVTAEVT